MELQERTSRHSYKFWKASSRIIIHFFGLFQGQCDRDLLSIDNTRSPLARHTQTIRHDCWCTYRSGRVSIVQPPIHSHSCIYQIEKDLADNIKSIKRPMNYTCIRWFGVTTMTRGASQTYVHRERKARATGECNVIIRSISNPEYHAPFMIEYQVKWLNFH